MSSTSPNKKSRLLELIQLPDSLDDAVLQPGSSSAQQHLPADEAQRQLGTLQLGSGDDPAFPEQAGRAVETRPDTSMTPADAASEKPATINPVPHAGEGATAATKMAPVESPAATGVEDVAGATFQKEASHEAAPSDPGVCVSYDIGGGSSALEGLGGDEGEGEVASRRLGSAALAGGLGADRGSGGGFEVFMGGLATDAHEDEVRAALAAMGQGEVLSVRLQLTRGTSICKGYGFATFADEAAAQRAIAGAAAGERLCGRRVGLHASRRPFRVVLATAQAVGSQSPLQLSADPEASINALLGALRSHPDRRAAVAAALQVMQRGAKRAFTATAAAAGPAVAADGGATAAAKTFATGKRQATSAAVDAAAAQTVTVKVEVTETTAPLGAILIDNVSLTSEAPVTAVVQVADAGNPAAASNEAPGGVQEGTVANEGAPPGQAANAEEKPAGTKIAAAGEKTPGPTTAAAPEKSSGAATVVAEKVPAAAGEQAAAGGSGGAGGMSQDLASALSAYPKISKLLNSLKGTTRVPKTPLMVLHEYATKMSYEVSYLETSDGPAGPYAVEARLSSGGPHGTTIATASGKARTKRDAKQVSAAACLEKLLEGPRGLSPQDLLPAPKPIGTTAARSGKASGPDRGPPSNTGASGRKVPPGRGAPSAAPASLPPPPHHHPHHRDALNRAVLPPPPPPLHSALMSSRAGGLPYGAGGGSHPGHIGRAPFNGGGSSGGSGGFVQPGLQPAHNLSAPTAGGSGRPGVGGGIGGTANPFGPPPDSRGGGTGRAPSGSDTYGAPGYGSFGYGSAGRGVSAGGSGSMVQIGLGSGAGSNGATSSGAKYGSLYGRENARDGGGLGLDSHGGSASFDMAAGQKRNYSTAMQAAYGLPASSQGLLPVQPPQQPVGSAPGAVMGCGSSGQDPFAVQASGVSQPPLQQANMLGQMPAPSSGFGQPVGSSGQPVFGGPQTSAGSFTQPLFTAQSHQPQQPQLQPLAASQMMGVTAAPPLQQAFTGYVHNQLQHQQQSQLSFSQQPAAVAGRDSGMYGAGQTVQLQPAQPQSLFAQQQPQQQPAQSGMYGMQSYSQPLVQQAQQQQPYGGVSQVQQGSLFGSVSMQQSHPQLQPQQQPQQLQPTPQPYSNYGTSGLNAFGGARSAGGLWS